MFHIDLLLQKNEYFFRVPNFRFFRLLPQYIFFGNFFWYDFEFKNFWKKKYFVFQMLFKIWAPNNFFGIVTAFRILTWVMLYPNWTAMHNITYCNRHSMSNSNVLSSSNFWVKTDHIGSCRKRPMVFRNWTNCYE